MRMKVAFILRKASQYVLAFGLTLVLAMVLLIASAFLPQERIQANILESINLVNHDVKNNSIFDRSDGSTLDVGTDVMILRTSISMRSRYIGSILTNPIYRYEGLSEWDDIGETLARLAYEMPHDNVWYYARYWLGFRGPMRLALTFFNYGKSNGIWLSCFFFCLQRL